MTELFLLLSGFQTLNNHENIKRCFPPQVVCEETRLCGSRSEPWGSSGNIYNHYSQWMRTFTAVLHKDANVLITPTPQIS